MYYVDIGESFQTHSHIGSRLKSIEYARSMRRRCTIAVVAVVVLAIATFSERRSNFAVTEPEIGILDEFAVPVLEDICQGRDAGTTGQTPISLTLASSC